MKQLMKPMEANPMRLLAGACSLVLTLGVAQPSVAQQTAKPQTQAQPVAAASAFDALAPVSFSSLLPGTATAQVAAKPAAEEEEESPKPQKPGHEGVKVHGHWVLQVKNADGTLGERREFENSLITTYQTTGTGIPADFSGSQFIVGILSGNLAVGDPAIGFIQGPLTDPPDTMCLTQLAVAASCYVFTSTNSFWNEAPASSFITTGYIMSSLGLTYRAVFTPSPAIILSGNYTVPTGLTSISAVQSLYGACIPEGLSLLTSATFRNADQSPHACGVSLIASNPSEVGIVAALTSTAVTSGTPPVPTPMAVTAGQVIQVTVTLSFS